MGSATSWSGSQIPGHDYVTVDGTTEELAEDVPSSHEKPDTRESDRNAFEDPTRKPTPETHVELNQILRKEMEKWYGTPHVLGGSTTRGVDCSGLVQRVFSDALGVQTSRTTDQLIEAGTKVRKTNLTAGDLVFFSPEQKRGGHVGIYLSNGEFAHASSSTGVTISHLDNPYWVKHFETGRRILHNEEDVRLVLDRIKSTRNLASDLQAGN